MIWHKTSTYNGNYKWRDNTRLSADPRQGISMYAYKMGANGSLTIALNKHKLLERN